jgi:cell division protein FtsN
MPRNASSRPSPALARSRAPRRTGTGGTLLGVFIGLVLGLGLAAGVAYYLMRANGPFPAQGGARDARELPKVAKADKGDAGTDKPRFDFYKILPGVEEPKVQAEGKKAPDRAVVEQAKERAAEKSAPKAGDQTSERVASVEATPAIKPVERFWLQAGSFATEADAENLKARLAFAGWQANVQQGTLPDKGIRYRVRLGPYDNTEELNRVRSDLAKNGFDVAVIKF